MTVSISSNPFASHLQELQRLSREARTDLQVPAESPEANFAGTLNQALEQVNNLQTQADRKITAVTAGQSQDTLGAIVALQKADLSMQLLAQVRNKVMKVYEEIIKMPI
ncbi:MAG: flagellar hook-basal body complex protein FliE [Deltaproteobacteria bacterium]|nr:flagellar hook-basal body complex protein FliE [Deltaproteobacteria bacterium]